MRNLVREFGRIICLGIALSTLPVHAAEFDETILKLLEEDEPTRRTEPSTPTPKSRTPGANSRDATSGATQLTLAEAERMAQENDAVSKSLREKASALGDQSIAAGRWPDPKLRLGVSEYPLNAAEDGEKTIRMVVGLQQAMIPSARRSHESAQFQLMSQGQSARVAQQKLLVLRETRKAWLNIFLQHHTALIVKQTHKLLGQLLQIAQNQYRVGSGNQSDVLQAQIELSLLKDKENQVETAREFAVAELTRWVGQNVANRSLALNTVDLPVVADFARIEQNLERGPQLQVMQLDADAAKEGVELARARATPEWMWEFETMWTSSQADRFSSDAVAAFVTVDIPFAKKNLQDRWLASSEKDYNSALFLVVDQRRDLKRMLDQESVNSKRLAERLTFYREVILPQAAQNVQAALRAYQAQVADFSQLMRARQQELDSKLETLRLLVERAMAQANLLYLSGDGV